MYPFVETVRIEDGMMQNISYHQQRMERTMKRFFPDTRVPSLAEVLNGRQWPVGKIWKRAYRIRRGRYQLHQG